MAAPSHGSPRPPRGALLLLAAALLGAWPSSAEPPTRALVVVKTLVIDGLGTRTVDTDSARVPFGSKGLLVKKVPYAGPPLSFRLAVLAGPPQPAGIPLTLSADVWGGESQSRPDARDVSHREEATVLGEEGSYLFEIDHDPRTDRRIVLSVTARPVSEADVPPPIGIDSGPSVTFQLEIVRESAGSTTFTDTQRLASMPGRPVTYSSGVRPLARPGGTTETIGLSVTIVAERVQGDLVTVKVELGGAEFIDEGRTQVALIRRTDVQTVTAGSRVEVAVTVPEAQPGQAEPAPGIRPVTYRVTVVPSLT